MKFLDLNTGYSFDALWSDGQTRGYTFWFPSGQSIGLTYTMPICIINDTETNLELEFEQNSVFSFISHNATETDIDGFKFNEPIYLDKITTTPELVNGKYLHLFNVSAKSETDGEFICNLYIKDYGYIRIGADFYIENEAIMINLGNNGIEIPHTVQKAIYDCSVHEDVKDNILMNRKYKELLSNYWDIIANKGSYKSLANAIDWFEWGDLIKVQEIWKHNSGGRIFFDNMELMSVVEEKYSKTLANFIKTTYISLYANLYEETNEYDSEYNPVLNELVTKWSKQDLYLKMSILAEFLGAFFLPIHLSLLHATIEDVVFTNTIKALQGQEHSRLDVVGNFDNVMCNIPDGKVFKLTNVKAQVTDKTVFASRNDYSVTFGVDLFPTDGTINDFNSFAANYYVGPGAIIPITLTIPNINGREFVKQTYVDFNPTDDGERRIYFYELFYSRGGKITIPFNFLAKSAKEYELRFTFITSASKTITKTVKFRVEDVDNLTINVYKVKSKRNANAFTYEDWLDTTCAEYMFRIQSNGQPCEYYSQYLPYMLPTNPLYAHYNGIKLNRTVIVNLLNEYNVSKYTAMEIRRLTYYLSDYLVFAKYKLDENGNKTDIMSHLIFVSKFFNAEQIPASVPTNYDVIRNDMVFYPQFHKLERIGGDTLDDYTISQYDAICCAVEIENNDGVVIPFRYGHLIDSAEWTFTNNTNLKPIEHPASTRQPFIASQKKEYIPDGFYDISFKYSLNDGTTQECRLDSAFRKKSI